jgi:hypothetical protein
MKKIFNKMAHLNIVDHPKITKDKITLEPYTASIYDIDELVKFCQENDLEFGIRGDSPYYPGHTFRIEIVRKNELKNLTT